MIFLDRNSNARIQFRIYNANFSEMLKARKNTLNKLHCKDVFCKTDS